VRRREFITLLGGAAVWPFRARAQQPERMRRIGALSGIAVDDPESQARIAAFMEALQQLGWTDGRNMRIDHRWGGGDPNNIRKQAAELATLAPDVILATGGSATEQLLQATRTVPIVFVIVPDPVGSGLVNRLSRPGRNVTGFMAYEYNLSGKWLELLKADCARCEASGRPSGSRSNSRDRHVRHHPVGGLVARRRSHADQRRQRDRDRAIDRCVRAFRMAV
jgi:putative tryptophan/tyrosine transport system substrate-binding protein